MATADPPDLPGSPGGESGGKSRNEDKVLGEKKMDQRLLACMKENQKKQRQGDNVFSAYPQMDGKGTATGGQFKADDFPAGYMLLTSSVQLDFKRSLFTVESLACLKENQQKQRQGDNVFTIYLQMDGKRTATGGQFKDNDSPAGYMLLSFSVQLERQGDNVFAIYPPMDGKGTTTGGQFKADDSPAGYMLLSCSVQLGFQPDVRQMKDVTI
uniref:Uncharacterized protein n=2 Tax=Brassica campestris TaxID=3711 RepID=M4F2M0_BRACM